MKNKIFWLAILLIVAIFIVGVIRVMAGEDNWVCQNGQWVKHGQPKTPMPTSICEK